MRKHALTATLALLLVAAKPVKRLADAGAADASVADAGAADASVADAGVADASAAGDAGAADTDAGASDAGAPAETCKEHVPEGARRPLLKEELAMSGLSGYAAELKLVITHGKGETVLPEGFHLQKDSDAAKALEKAGFVIPDPDGGVGPKLEVQQGEGGAAVTTLTLPVVPLPPKPGRNVMELPPLPIAIWRASNDYITVCTKPHTILVEDPINNEVDPKVKPNPPGRAQREDWPLMRYLAAGLPIGLAIAIAGALAQRWWSRRPKPEPEAPKIPPWVTALEELDQIKGSTLLADGKAGEYFDRVSFTVRRYLGARYGFDAFGGVNGLEATTGEMLALLKRVRPPILELPRIKAFLEDCDLVKFARFEPTDEHCLESLQRGELIVRKTIPVMQFTSEPQREDLPPAEGSS